MRYKRMCFEYNKTKGTHEDCVMFIAFRR